MSRGTVLVVGGTGMLGGRVARRLLRDGFAVVRAEEAIRRSGVPHTIFRPTYFMETLPRHVRGRLAVIMGRQPHRLHMVAADDFARMVSRSFDTPEAVNRTFYVHGPEAISIPDALRLYCSLVEPGTRYGSARGPEGAPGRR